MKKTSLTEWRTEVVNLAAKYAEFEWKASDMNTFHGYDDDGVLVNTPDTGFTSEVYDCGWWRPNQINTGMAYSWGGSTTIEEFDRGIEYGKFVGNVPDSRDKRVSKYCIGLDCSGLVTICWGLEKKVSTMTIPQISTELESLSVLQPGDVILKPGSHVMIFIEYIDDGELTAKIIDASRNTGKVLKRNVELNDLFSEGYRGYRKNYTAKEII